MSKGLKSDHIGNKIY